MKMYRKTLPVLLAVLLLPGLIANFWSVRASAQVTSGGSILLETVAEGLVAPLTLVEPPDGTGRLFIVDQVGLIRIVTADGQLLPDPFLDLRAGIVNLSSGGDERGLLGLAFHPDYASNGRFFVYYSAPLRDGAPAGYNCTATYSEFHVSANPNIADPASERIVLEIDKPQGNHNGGSIAFGPDGYLYLSIGDGGGGNDVGLGHVDDWYADNAGGNGQDVEQNLLGSILRIDVDGGEPYAIPPDNPFVGEAGLDEIYAYGFRNPYRFSFDMGGEFGLLVGDAGQSLWEEVDQAVRGGNYGWNVREGTHCFDAEAPTTIPSSCPDMAPNGDPLRDPVIEYANNENPFAPGMGNAVIGGYVYRGSLAPQLAGHYLFGDWSSSFTPPDGVLFLATPGTGDLWGFEELVIANSPNGRLNRYLLGFGQDGSGEVYVLTSESRGPTGETGMVFRVEGLGNSLFLPAILQGLE